MLLYLVFLPEVAGPQWQISVPILNTMKCRTTKYCISSTRTELTCSVLVLP